MYKDNLAFGSNSLPFLWCKHTKPGKEPEDGGYAVLVVQRRSCYYVTVCPFYGINIPSLARNLKMVALLSWVYKDDLAFRTNSLPFLRWKHTEPGEEPEDGGNVVLVVQRWSCLSALSKMKTYQAWRGTWRWWLCCPGCTKTILLLCNSLPFLWHKHTEPGEEPEDGGFVVLVVQRRSCFYF